MMADPASPGATQQAGFLRPFESEALVIGAALNGLDWAVKLTTTLKPEHFSEPPLQRVWAAIRDLAASGITNPDGALVADRLGDDPGFNELGGVAFLADLLDRTPVWTAQAHAEVVMDRAWRRRLIAVAEEGKTNAANDPEKTAFDHIADLEREIAALLQSAAPADTYLIGAQEAAFGTVERLEAEAASGKTRGLLTGLRCFDMRTRGLQPGWMIVLAGRPSMGKTALARSTAMATALRNPRTTIVYFALEMDRDELSERMLSELSFLRGEEGIAYKDMAGASLTPEERSRLRRMASLVPLNLVLDDSPVLSVGYIRRRLYALKAKGPLGAAFIDYLQIMQRPAANGRNEAAVIQEITQALKSLARELGICIVLLSQVNRGVEGREDKRPQLSDLRESGAIEQDANAVLVCYREFYYLERAEPKRARDGKKEQDAHFDWEMRCEDTRRRMDVLALKVRAGAVGTDRQTYFAEYDHVEDQRAA